MKRVIVVKGSEDGILGVATSLKQAMIIARRCGYPVDEAGVDSMYRDYVAKYGRIKAFWIQVPVGSDYVEFDAYYLNT